MQAGEKRSARRLGTHLEDDYLCWYETGPGQRPKYADFVILYPLRASYNEIADIQIYLIMLADKLGVDIESAVQAKIETNARKYPASPV